MISVIIPLYNKEASIKQTLMSILSQSYQEFEVVIVDDGSTDNSVAIVEEFQDMRVRLIRQPNGGPSKARNVGVSNARGEWILFIDADDEILPNAILCFEQYIQNVPNADMFLGEVLINSTEGKKNLKCQYMDGFLKNPFKYFALHRLYQCSGTTVYRKELCLLFPFDERVRRYEDLERLFKLYKHFNLYLCHVAVAQVNIEYSCASHPRKNIKEDFMGHLDFKGKSFWEKISLYSLFLAERENYDEQCRKLYPWLYRRYDWLIIYKMLNYISYI